MHFSCPLAQVPISGEEGGGGKGQPRPQWPPVGRRVALEALLKMINPLRSAPTQAGVRVCTLRHVRGVNRKCEHRLTHRMWAVEVAKSERALRGRERAREREGGGGRDSSVLLTRCRLTLLREVRQVSALLRHTSGGFFCVGCFLFVVWGVIHL